MKCILCNSDYELYTKTSYLELPTFHCKKCNLVITGDSESEIITKTNQIYKQKHWGKGNLWDAENAIRSIIQIRIHKVKKERGFLNTNTANLT